MGLNAIALGLIALVALYHAYTLYLNRDAPPPSPLPVPVQTHKSRSFHSQTRDAGLFTEGSSSQGDHREPGPARGTQGVHERVAGVELFDLGVHRLYVPAQVSSGLRHHRRRVCQRGLVQRPRWYGAGSAGSWWRVGRGMPWGLSSCGVSDAARRHCEHGAV